MAYIGKTPSQATRARYYFTATGGETSLSGADDNGNTLVFSDGNYVDVMLNGVNLVADTDYNTTTANTIGGLTALTASDIVEIVVYDTFSVFGGDVKGDFNVQNGTLSADTATLQNLSSTNSPLNISSSASDGSATLDASGRLLIGTTDTNPTTTSDNGIAIQDDGRIFGHRGDWALSRSSDGAFINFFESTGGTRSSVLGTIGIDGGGFGVSFDGGSNYLDDYEEGTFTPTLSGGASGITYSLQRGSYTKVGNLVTYQIQIDIQTATPLASGIRIGGLPFSSYNATTYGHGGAFLNYQGGFNTNAGDTFHHLSSSTNIGIYTSSGAARTGTGSGIALGGGFALCGQYFTAA